MLRKTKSTPGTKRLSAVCVTDIPPRKAISRYLKESKIIAISAFVGILFAVSVAAYSYVYSTTTQANIANNVIRFHVLANSNSKSDQNLKERVRTEILKEFQDYLSSAPNIETTRKVLTEKLPEMEALAEEIITRWGGSYSVTANITTVFFPTRFYGSLAFPPGKYEAVQLIIGEGQGNNWWCLMFPPLCYVDMTATEAGREQLAETITEEGLRLLMHQEKQSRNLEIRFRIVEFWQNRMEEAEQSEEYDNF